MRSFISTLGIVSVVFLLSACGPRTVEPVEPLERPRDVSDMGWHTYWQMPLNLAAGERVISMHRIDDVLYCMTNNGALISMDPSVGIVHWRTSVGNRSDMPFTPIHANNVTMSRQVPGSVDLIENRLGLHQYNVVMVNTRSRLFVIDRQSGVVLRDIRLGFSASTGGATNGELFVVGSADASFRAINIQNAVEQWSMWSKKSVISPLEYARGMFFVAGRDGIFRGVLAQGRESSITWTRDLGAPVSSPFAVDDRGVFVACDDGRLHMFNPASGKPVWGYPYVMSGETNQGILLSAMSAFVSTKFSGLCAVNVANGQERWQLAEGTTVLAAGEGKVFVRNNRNQVLTVDEVLGKVLDHAMLGDLSVFVSQATEQTIWACDSSNTVRCIRPVSSGQVSKQMLDAAVR